MEDSKLTNRLTLAVYLFLAALAVILALVGIKYIQNDSPTRDLILNLSTEILGVVIIFFIVNQLFLLNREKDLVKQIDSFKNEIKSKFSPLKWQKEIFNDFKIQEEIKDAESIYCIGFNLRYVLKNISTQLSNAISNGTNVKIIIVDPNSIAGDLLRKNFRKESEFDEDYNASKRNISEIINETKKKTIVKGNFEVKIVSLIPNCGMILINREKQNGIAIVKIKSFLVYVPLGKLKDNLHIFLKQEENPNEFEYYKTNFDLLWESNFAKKLNELSI